VAASSLCGKPLKRKKIVAVNHPILLENFFDQKNEIFSRIDLRVRQYVLGRRSDTKSASSRV
jgi:hypothetical protein